MELTGRKCRPCKDGTPKLSENEVKRLLTEIPTWSVVGGRLKKNFKFKDFRQAIKFLNQIAEIAEAENHHPDFSVHYNLVEIEIWTHIIDGLSENDFILAAKLDAIRLT